MNGKRIVYSDRYDVDIGAHVFPTKKYKLIYQRLIDEKLLPENSFIYPCRARDKDILLVHSQGYLTKLKTGALNAEELFKLELPYSPELVEASYICVDGTAKSCKLALEDGIGVHIGGGFHHAFSDHGEGFCIFNDIAIGIKKMLTKRKVKKAMVIDCDLHQGNGTADIFKNERNVFTFSMHQQNNYPFYKPKSDLDIGLDDHTPEKTYIAKLQKHIPDIISSFKPQLLLYVAGADPYKNDKVGSLGLTIDGLRQRDEFIIETARNFGIPIAIVLAGGYAVDVRDTVTIHFNTIKTALGHLKS